MGLRSEIIFLVFAYFLLIVDALPNSLLEQIKNSDLKNNKVKRAQISATNPEEESTKDVSYYGGPTAIKRGGTLSNLKNLGLDQQTINEWEREQEVYQNPGNVAASIQSSLYNNGDSYDDKTISEYEKGFHYGTNKEKLDEALENAVLKSELYGEPIAMNQYRYYGNDDKRRRRRKRRQTTLKATPRLDRIKREIDLTPEEVLSILTLYDNDRQNGYRPWNFDRSDPSETQDGDEQWMDTPVYPQLNRANDLGPEYMFEDKRGRWGNLVDDHRAKRFMVAKRYPSAASASNRNNFYTLSQLLNNQREPNVPLYHRLIL